MTAWKNLVLVTLMLVGLAACGDTWRGIKEDTGENMQSTGKAMENAGEKVQP